jgi:hypothetical protein
MQRVTKQYWLGLLITVASAPLAAEMLNRLGSPLNNALIRRCKPQR